VLVDEIDAHLHIEWQQEIGFWLTEHFPNIQFLVTTHSPFVCQAARERGLFRLPGVGEDAGVERIDGELWTRVVNGTANDAALSHLFGLRRVYSRRSARIRRELAEVQLKMFEGGEGEALIPRYEALRAQLPSTDADIAEQEVQRLAIARESAE
jgi:predicted ATP-binding protein involved in virulence